MAFSKNPSDLTTEERERWIRHFMRSGMTRPEAEAAAAIELGESSGNLIDLDQADNDEE